MSTVVVDQMHYTDMALILARECAPIVGRNEGKTGMYWGPGAEALVVDLLDYLADRRDLFNTFCESRDQQIQDAPEPAYVPKSWLETDEAPTRIKGASVGEIIAECSLIPMERREEALSPIVAWGEATGFDFPRLDALRSAIMDSLPAVEVELDLDNVKAGDELDWIGEEPAELAGRHVKVVGFGKTPGTLRVVSTGPWHKDPNVKEPIGGSGPTSSFMGNGDEAIKLDPPAAPVKKAAAKKSTTKATAAAAKPEPALATSPPEVEEPGF